MTEQDKDLPVITVKDNVLSISMELKDLIHIIENKYGDDYKVINPDKLLDAFKKELETYDTQNSCELGITALQLLFDNIVDEIYINTEGIIKDENEDN